MRLNERDKKQKRLNTTHQIIAFCVEAYLTFKQSRGLDQDSIVMLNAGIETFLY